MRGLSIVISKALATDLPSGSPIEAPVRTVTRAFLKGGYKPQEYYQKTSDLKDSIEAETRPHPCVFSWIIDTAPEGQYEWLMFGGTARSIISLVCVA
jgi:hypothetical protein